MVLFTNVLINLVDIEKTKGKSQYFHSGKIFHQTLCETLATDTSNSNQEMSILVLASTLIKIWLNSYLLMSNLYFLTCKLEMDFYFIHFRSLGGQTSVIYKLWKARQTGATWSMQPEISVNTMNTTSIGNKMGRLLSYELFSPRVKYLKRVMPE